MAVAVAAAETVRCSMQLLTEWKMIAHWDGWRTVAAIVLCDCTETATYYSMTNFALDKLQFAERDTISSIFKQYGQKGHKDKYLLCIVRSNAFSCILNSGRFSMLYAAAGDF